MGNVLDAINLESYIKLTRYSDMSVYRHAKQIDKNLTREEISDYVACLIKYQHAYSNYVHNKLLDVSVDLFKLPETNLSKHISDLSIRIRSSDPRVTGVIEELKDEYNYLIKELDKFTEEELAVLYIYRKLSPYRMYESTTYFEIYDRVISQLEIDRSVIDDNSFLIRLFTYIQLESARVILDITPGTTVEDKIRYMIHR